MMQGGNDLLRVMSFNVLLDWRREGPYIWANRKEMVADMIRFHHVDLAGLQEPLRNQVDDLSELLPEYAWLGIGREDGKNAGEFAALFYRKDRLEPVSHGTFWLSETPELPGSMGWDAACVRVVTWAKFLDKHSGRTFFHFNTHFDHVGMTAQAKSARLLLSKITDTAGGEPVLVTGDFNCREESETYRILTGSGRSGHEDSRLRDARYISLYRHHGSVVTFHGLEDEQEKEKIDYIFIKNNIRILQHGVLDDRWESGYPSDHSPVVADVIIG